MHPPTTLHQIPTPRPILVTITHPSPVHSHEQVLPLPPQIGPISSHDPSTLTLTLTLIPARVKCTTKRAQRASLHRALEALGLRHNRTFSPPVGQGTINLQWAAKHLWTCQGCDMSPRAQNGRYTTPGGEIWVCPMLFRLGAGG